MQRRFYSKVLFELKCFLVPCPNLKNFRSLYFWALGLAHTVMADADDRLCSFDDCRD